VTEYIIRPGRPEDTTESMASVLRENEPLEVTISSAYANPLFWMDDDEDEPEAMRPEDV
jgi:hypothetical protein